MAPLRILLVDDSPTFLESATRFLLTDQQLTIIGRALSGEAALREVARLCPDLVLMDIAMPTMNGLEATRRIKEQRNPPYIVILTLSGSREYRTAAEAAGADGFVPKSELGTALLPLIHSLLP